MILSSSNRASHASLFQALASSSADPGSRLSNVQGWGTAENTNDAYDIEVYYDGT